MKTFILAVLVSVFASVGFAQSARINSSQAQTLSDAPEMTNSNIVRYKKAMEYWQAGTMPTEAQFLGQWRLVGFNTNQACAFLGKDEYDSAGLKNADGSASGSAKFHMQQDGDDFGGPVTSSLMMSLFNLGGKGFNQGPYPVHTTDSVQTFQYAYYGGCLSPTTMLDYSCRVLANNDTRMVCGLNLVKADQPNSLEKACVGQMGAFNLFIKNE